MSFQTFPSQYPSVPVVFYSLFVPFFRAVLSYLSFSPFVGKVGVGDQEALRSASICMRSKNNRLSRLYFLNSDDVEQIGMCEEEIGLSGRPERV